ncbi:MAG: adenylate/guanylate cyclase domain-containing protein [Treponema sp.]|nr:adenylate/guanylate cyclase domain-containing protein [Treponema sp.]
MSSEELKPGEYTKITLSETEYDILERKLVVFTKTHDVYRAISEWIIARMNPAFIFFYADMHNNSSRIQYCIKRKSSECQSSQYIQERKAASVDCDVVFFHPSGCLSIPFRPRSTSVGCVFIGASENDKVFLNGQLKLLMPVIRILNKALLYCEADMAREERNRLQDAFSHYVSPDIVNDILHNPDIIHLGGEKKFLTCIFTDLQGFTPLADSMDPILLVRVLNMYLNEMSQVIIALGGTIDKFEGDAIMAFFGAPHELSDHAVRCCLAALRMKRMEKVLNDQLIREGLITVPLFTRIGINSGDMVVGNVGSMQRLDYTVIGSNVNIASRLENANKDFNTSVLISGSTYDLVKDYFVCSCLGHVTLKGVRRPVEVYQLLEQKEGIVLDYDNTSGDDFTSDNTGDDVQDLEEL